MSDDNIDGFGTRRGDDIEDFRPFYVASLICLVLGVILFALQVYFEW